MIIKNQVSAHDYSRAKIARALQRRIDRPTTKTFIHYVIENLIPNCPITVHDIKMPNSYGDQNLGPYKERLQDRNHLRSAWKIIPYLCKSCNNTGM